MPKQISLTVKESEAALKTRLKRITSVKLRSRIQMLLLIKSKRLCYYNQIADRLGFNKNSIFSWASLYADKGIEGLLTVNSGGNNPSKITPEIHAAIEQRLNDPSRPFTSYRDLQFWVQDNYLPTANYHTLNKYVKRHFKAGLKVGRRSHVKKDPLLVEHFLKTG